MKTMTRFLNAMFQFSESFMLARYMYLCALKHMVSVDADCVRGGSCRDELLLFLLSLLWGVRRPLVRVGVATRTLDFGVTTLLIDNGLVKLLSICIDGSFDIFAEENSNVE